MAQNVIDLVPHFILIKAGIQFFIYLHANSTVSVQLQSQHEYKQQQ
jgi:sRNA-binding regulator protein Hfq